MNALKLIKAIILAAFAALFCNVAAAQTGDDNPYGANGTSPGEIMTGGEINPYTMSARRTITDISLPSMSSYPLEFSRTMSSRFGSANNAPVGQATRCPLNGSNYCYDTVWSHSYEWQMPNFSESVCGHLTGCAPLTVTYPDGSSVAFSPSADPYWRGGLGVRERMEIIEDTITSGRVYIHLADGGKVLFNYVRTSNGTQWTFTFTLSQIIDPYGQITTIAGQPDNSTIVTEPGGRWLHIYYKHPGSTEGNGSDWVVYEVTASDGRQVNYNYTLMSTGSPPYPFTTLTSVNYSWDPNLTATYTYRQNNVQPRLYPPLVSTAVDPLFAGPMWRIAYAYNGTAPGQISSENYFDGTTVGAAVTTVVYNSQTLRTETRADGKTRTFSYNSSTQFVGYTDFQSHSSSLGYCCNNFGFPTTFTDFRQNVTNITYDLYTVMTEQTTFPATPEDAPAGRGVASKSYTSSGCTAHCDPNNMDTNNEYYLFSSTDEAGNTIYYNRDTNKRVTSIFYPDGGSEAFTYNSFGQTQTHTLKTGDVITYQYDSHGLLQLWYDQEHSASAPNYRFGYDSLDRLNTVTDALGSSLGDTSHTINYTYTSRNEINVVTLPVDPVDGVRHTITHNYNPVDGTLASVVDQLNHSVSFTYDNYKRVKTLITPGHGTPETASLFYGSTDSGDDYTHTDSNPTFVKLPSGKEAAIVYDENHRKKSVTVAYGTADAATTSYSYDANGNLTSKVAPNEQPGQQYAGQSTSTSYDERNRAYSTTDALNDPPSSTMFDAYGRVATATRSNGQVSTVNSYDPMNRALQKTVSQSPDPNAVSKYTYYPSGLLHTFQDPHLVALGSTDSYSYVYDSLGRKTSLTYPKASPSATPAAESWHYDTAGRNDTFTNRNGVVRTNSFDGLNRVTGSSWNDGLTPAVTYGYDVASRSTSVTNSNAVIAWQYFNDGLANTETSTYADSIPRTVTYTYDDDSNRASINYPGNSYAATYGYTNRNQLLQVVNSSNIVAIYGYDPDGNLLSRIIRENGTSSSFQYDGLDRVTHIAHGFGRASTPPTTRTFDYGYDSVGNQLWVKRDGANGDVFSYDKADQSTAILLNVANPNTTSPGNQTVFYDEGGNRTTFQAEGLNNSYATNPLNQYTTRDSSSAAYDATGNMMAGFDGSGYTFDALDRVLSATKAGNTDTFQYDGLGRQIAITRNGTTTYNVYDGWDLIGEYSPGYPSTYNYYVYGAGDLIKNSVLIVSRFQSKIYSLYHYQDAHGSTSHLADYLANLSEYYQYDLQGAPLFFNSSGTQNTASIWGIRNLFNGEQWLSELGLYDLRSRFYSPDIGRFVQADPSGHAGGDNLYRYCGNNPMNSSDPMGLADGPIWDPWLGAFPSPYAVDFVNNWYDSNFNLAAAVMQYPPGYYSFDNGVAGMEATFAQEHSYILQPPIPAYTWSPQATVVQSPSWINPAARTPTAEKPSIGEADRPFPAFYFGGTISALAGERAGQLTFGVSTVEQGLLVYLQRSKGTGVDPSVSLTAGISPGGLDAETQSVNVGPLGKWGGGIELDSRTHQWTGGYNLSFGPALTPFTFSLTDSETIWMSKPLPVDWSVYSSLGRSPEWNLFFP